MKPPPKLFFVFCPFCFLKKRDLYDLFQHFSCRNTFLLQRVPFFFLVNLKTFLAYQIKRLFEPCHSPIFNSENLSDKGRRQRRISPKAIYAFAVHDAVFRERASSCHTYYAYAFHTGKQ